MITGTLGYYALYYKHSEKHGPSLCESKCIKNQICLIFRLIMWKTGIGSKVDENIERDFAITLPPIEEIENEQVGNHVFVLLSR